MTQSEFPLENTSFWGILRGFSTAFCDFITSKVQAVPTKLILSLAQLKNYAMEQLINYKGKPTVV